MMVETTNVNNTFTMIHYLLGIYDLPQYVELLSKACQQNKHTVPSIPPGGITQAQQIDVFLICMCFLK